MEKLFSLAVYELAVTLRYRENVKVDVYRSCTWREKRDVLNVFWRTNVDASARIVEASVQYGYYAVICLVIVMVEVALILGVAIDRNTRSSPRSRVRPNSS